MNEKFNKIKRLNPLIPFDRLRTGFDKLRTNEFNQGYFRLVRTHRRDCNRTHIDNAADGCGGCHDVGGFVRA